MLPYLESKAVRIFTSYNKESYDFPSHFHSNFETCFCFSGEQQVKVGNAVYTLTEGDAVVIFPGTVHEYIKSKIKDTESVSVICSLSLLKDIFPALTSLFPENPVIKREKLSPDTALSFRKTTEINDEALLLGWTLIALSDLLKNVDLIPLSNSAELPSQIVSYVNDNFKEPLTIKSISKVFGYHPSYIAHLFCDRLKIPFRTYLGALRCEYASTQIKTTEKSLTEIAFDSGFNSLNTFCRAFKKHLGKTPSQYKKEA